MLQCYRQLRGLEQRLRIAPFVTSLLAAAIGALLVVDLFAYRLVPATRSLALGSISLDWLGAGGHSSDGIRHDDGNDDSRDDARDGEACRQHCHSERDRRDVQHR